MTRENMEGRSRRQRLLEKMAERSNRPLIRQQYLIPEPSVHKVRELGKLQNVSGTEIVRRAIDAYTPGAEGEEDAEAAQAIEDLRASLRHTLKRIDAHLRDVEGRLTKLSDGSLRFRVRQETLEWIERNRRTAAQIAELFGGGVAP